MIPDYSKFYLVIYRQNSMDPGGYFKQKLRDWQRENKIKSVVKSVYVCIPEFINEFVEFLERYVEIIYIIPVDITECLFDPFFKSEDLENEDNFINNYIRLLERIKEGKVPEWRAKEIIEDLKKGEIAVIKQRAIQLGNSEEKIDEFVNLALELITEYLGQEDNKQIKEVEEILSQIEENKKEDETVIDILSKYLES